MSHYLCLTKDMHSFLEFFYDFLREKIADFITVRIGFFLIVDLDKMFNLISDLTNPVLIIIKMSAAHFFSLLRMAIDHNF